MHVLKVHSDDIYDRYNVVSENETLIQQYRYYTKMA